MGDDLWTWPDVVILVGGRGQCLARIASDLLWVAGSPTFWALLGRVLTALRSAHSVVARAKYSSSLCLTASTW